MVHIDPRLDPLPLPPISERANRTLAQRKLTEKWTALGGGPGAEKTPGNAGLIGAGGRYYREYANGGRLYCGNDTNVVSFVYGDIGKRYYEIGGAASWMGWPISDELDFVEGGRISKFENGAIYWWPETGAIELRNVAVRYRGLVCFGTSDERSDSDEPYVWLTASPPPPGEPFTARSPIYDDVDEREARPNNIEIYRGLPFGLLVGVVLMEHDATDPDQYRDTIKTAVGGASVAVAGAVTLIPVVGPVLGPVVGAALVAAQTGIVDGLNDLVGGAPDHLGTKSLSILPKQMVTMTRAARQDYNGVQWHLETEPITDGEATYKVYFDIQAV